MLTATEARKASVQGMFLKPSTKRSEVGNPTSNKPPTISKSQGMNILSLDGRAAFVTLQRHGEWLEPRQQACAAALSCVPRHAANWIPRCAEPPASLAARGDERIRSRDHPVPDFLRSPARNA